jgi:8-oxo-dGTP pyrophosphatase MutT (NUDIX family)
MSLAKNICLNCGKNGHMIKKCSEPITSNGIICFTLDDTVKIKNKTIETFFYNKYLDISEFNYENLNNIKLIPNFYDKIKIVMIRRKHSLNYIEFMRGKYDVNDMTTLSRLFNLMSRDENIKIKQTDFVVMWDDLWKETSKNKIYQKEFNMSKQKFDELKENNFYNLLDDINLSKYMETEWGFPKGRRNAEETNFNCAVREFCEETNIEYNNILLLERLNPIEEIYDGTNNIKYRHNYFLASINNMVELVNNNDNYEIGDIQWFTIPEIINKIRPYDVMRIQIVHQIYFFLINLIMNIYNSNNMLNNL